MLARDIVFGIIYNNPSFSADKPVNITFTGFFVFRGIIRGIN